MTKIKKIKFKCVKATEGTYYKGFIKDKIYKGRSFNNLYEITTEWASHQPTFLIEKKDFEKYFTIVEEKEKQEV